MNIFSFLKRPASGDWEYVYSRRVIASDGGFVDTAIDYDADYDYAFGGFGQTGICPVISDPVLIGVFIQYPDGNDAASAMAYSPNGGVNIYEVTAIGRAVYVPAGNVLTSISAKVINRSAPGAQWQYDGSGGFAVKQSIPGAGDTSYAVIARRKAV